jgi:TonB family protein
VARALIILLSWSSAFAFAGTETPKPVDLSMIWSLSVDATGAITSLEPAEDRNPELYRRLEPAIRTWHFTSGKFNGTPVPAETTLTVHITLQPTEGGYRVQLRRADTGASYSTTTPPKYPDGALVSHRGGAVLLLVHYDADGHVTDAEPRVGGEPKPGGDIATAAVNAVKHWTFKPERVAGRGVPGAAKVPLCFKVEPSRLSCRFMEPGTNLPLDPDRPLAIDSIVRIETNVVGQML